MIGRGFETILKLIAAGSVITILGACANNGNQLRSAQMAQDWEFATPLAGGHNHSRVDTTPPAGPPGQFVKPKNSSLQAQESQLIEITQLPSDAVQAVNKWIHYFEKAGHSRMELYLARSPLYLQKMRQILKENGVPEDMVYVAMIESGFNDSARSRAHAVGYWQFLAGTARRYGLRITATEDQRRDPILSTVAAAKYLKGLYLVFGSWELALAAYNVGENRVQYIILSTLTRDYWAMSRKHLLPQETRNYVPKFIAAALIAQNPTAFGFNDIKYVAPLRFEEVSYSNPVNLVKLAQSLNVAYSELKQYNPSYLGEYAPLGDDHEVRIRIPANKSEIVMAEK